MPAFEASTARNHLIQSAPFTGFHPMKNQARNKRRPGSKHSQFAERMQRVMVRRRATASRKEEASVTVHTSPVNKGGPLSDMCLAWLAKRLSSGLTNDPSRILSLPLAHQEVLNSLKGVASENIRETLRISASSVLSIEQTTLLNAFDKLDPHACDPSLPKTMADVATLVSGVTWLWPNWVPQGLVTLVVADPGVGKSAFVLGCMVKAVTSDSSFIDGTAPLRRGPVIWCDTEATHAGNLDRIRDWGINPQMLFMPGKEALDGFKIVDPSHIERVRELAFMNDVSMIVIDSLRNAHDCDENSSEMAEVMQTLVTLAQELQIAIVAIHHLKKRQFGQPADLNSVRGSSTIGAAVRSAIFLDRPRATSRVVSVTSGKHNFSLPPESLAFEMTINGIYPAQPQSESISAIESASNFLTEFLQEGPVRSTEVLEAALAAGISPTTLQRAKGPTGVTRVKYGTEWYFYLPTSDDQVDTDEDGDNVDNLDNVQPVVPPLTAVPVEDAHAAEELE